jgi:hypothetical protein
MRDVRRCATVVSGKVKKGTKKLRQKIINVNFRSIVHFSQKTDKNENNKTLIKKLTTVKFQQLPSLMFPIPK